MRVGKKSQGFTLIELLIIIVLLAIFASMAMPAFSLMIKNNRLQSSAAELQSLLIAARTDAVTKRQAVTVTRQDDNSWNAVQGGVTVRKVDIPDSVAQNPSADTITFQPDGTASALSIGVTNSEETALYTVSVSLPGLIKVEKTTPSHTETE